MPDKTSAVLARVFKPISVFAASARIDLAVDQQCCVLGIKQLVPEQRRREFQQITDGRISAAGGSPAIGQRIRVGSPVTAASRTHISDRSAGDCFTLWL